ncbi:MAG: ABC transporter substrate-binding protein [Bdellovibrionales bacterium]
MVKNILYSLTFLVLSSFLLSCSSSQPKPQPVTPAQKQLLQKTKKLLATNKKETALKSLEKLALTPPESAASHEANMTLGLHYSHKREYAAAAPFFQRVFQSRNDFGYKAQAGMHWAQTQLDLKQYPEALQTANAVLKTNGLDVESAIGAQKVLAQVYLQNGSTLEALNATIAVSEASTNAAEKESYRLKALDIVDAKLTDKQVEQVASRYSQDYIRGGAYYRLGTALFEQGFYDEARSKLSSVRSYLKEGQMIERANEIIEQIDSRRTVDADVVGAVLPLTGKNAKIGYKTLKGLQLGLGIFGPNKSRYKLSVVDSEGNPEVARRAFRQMILSDHPIAVVGSLLSKTAIPIANKGQEFGVPTIGLSQKSGITETGEYVFRNALTSEMQVQQLVHTAMTVKKMSRFAIIYPNDAYGVEFANLFWDEVLARGGHIVGAQTYDPKETDFRGPVKRLVGTYFVEARTEEYNSRLQAWKSKQKNISAQRDLPKDILPPIIDFDGVFIPDSTKAVGQIAGMLVYNDIVGVPLLGTNLWNAGGLIERAGKAAEGALFVDSTKPQAQSDGFFTSHFQKTFGYAPEYFELQGYDTGLLVRMVLDSGVSSRSSFKERLEKVSNFRGATGNLNVSERREVLRPLSLYTVEKGQIRAF